MTKTPTEQYGEKMAKMYMERDREAGYGKIVKGDKRLVNPLSKSASPKVSKLVKDSPSCPEKGVVSKLVKEVMDKMMNILEQMRAEGTISLNEYSRTEDILLLAATETEKRAKEEEFKEYNKMVKQYNDLLESTNKIANELLVAEAKGWQDEIKKRYEFAKNVRRLDKTPIYMYSGHKKELVQDAYGNMPKSGRRWTTPGEMACGEIFEIENSKDWKAIKDNIRG